MKLGADQREREMSQIVDFRDGGRMRKMVQKWLAPAIALAVLVCGPAKAAVTYTFYDYSAPETVDLEYSLDTQLTPDNTPEEFNIIVTGRYASEFGGAGYVKYLTTPNQQFQFIGFVPWTGEYAFVGGVPGNGVFHGAGNLFDGPNPVAILGEMTVSGVPVGVSVPEPATWVTLSLGFAGLAAAAIASRKTRVTFS